MLLVSSMQRSRHLFQIRRTPLIVAVVVWIIACESPRYPELCGSTPEQTIVVGESVTVDFCFNDPNGEMLAFEVFNSDPGVVTAAAAGSVVTVSAISPGVALVTMVATDPTGLKAQQSFRVVVPNRPPTAVGLIEDRELMAGDSTAIDVSGHFSEPDGQPLSFVAEVSDSGRVAVSVEETVVTVVAMAKGAVEVTVTATDPGGLAAMQRFQVRVPNQPPVPVDSIAAREVMVDSADTLEVLPYFSDPDGDALTYVATVSDSSVVTATVVESVLTIAGVARGEAVVTVTATDDEGLSATQRFNVTVPNQPPEVTDTIPSRTLFKHEADTLELTAYFADPDGDALRYAAAVSDSTVVAAAVVESALTVTGVAQGEAEVTITAIDGDGLFAAQRFQVTVPNRPPMATDTIRSRTLFKNEADTLKLTAYFADPDGEALTWEAQASDRSVVALELSTTDGKLTVTALSQGEAVITVTATDAEGLGAHQSFAVTVPNRAPLASEGIPARTLHKRETAELDLAQYFSDPDGDILSYVVESTDTLVVTATVRSSTLTARAGGTGEATLTVIATDPGGLSVRQSFMVTVPNRAPTVIAPIPTQTVPRGRTQTVDLSAHFDDADGDPLTYSAESSNQSVVRVQVSGSSVTLTGQRSGTARVSVTATDPESLTAEHTFTVTTVAGEGSNPGGQGNTAPTATGEIPGQTIAEGASRTLVVSSFFQDPNGDPLTFSAATANPDLATASASGASVTLTGVTAGTTTLTITATDPGNLSTSRTADVTVVARGQRPVVVGSIPEQRPRVGRATTVSMAGYFQDPDGSSLDFEAESSNPGIVTAVASGSDVTLTGVSVGSTSVTVTATDSDGLSADLQIGVRVVELSPDLEVGSASVTASSVEPGGTFRLSVTVSNAGEGESSATTLRYYRSSGGTDTQVGTDDVGALAAGESSAQSIDLPAPSTEGTYHYSACVDAVTGESDATDNCSGSVQVDVESLRGIPARVEVTAPRGWAPVGGTVTYRAGVLDSHGDAVAGAQVSWSSSHPAIASVNASGVVTAIAVGEATVTATVSGSAGAAALAQAQASSAPSPQALGENAANARTSISGSQGMHVVEPVARVVLDPTSLTFDAVNASQTLMATIYDADDNEMEPTYWGWGSADRTVATVSTSLGSSTERATVYAVGEGETTVTLNANGTEGSASVTVALSGRRVEVLPSSLNFDALGQTKSVTVRVLDENGDEDENATWTTFALFTPCCEPNLADPPQGIAVETTDDGLTVTANGPGRGSISVSSAGAHSGIVQLSVSPKPASLAITPDSVDVTVAGTTTLRATVTDANGHSIQVSDGERGGLVVYWESDDSTVATVTGVTSSTRVGNTGATATVTAKAAGSATITARWGGATIAGTATVVVTAGGGSE